MSRSLGKIDVQELDGGEELDQDYPKSHELFILFNLLTPDRCGSRWQFTESPVEPKGHKFTKSCSPKAGETTYPRSDIFIPQQQRSWYGTLRFWNKFHTPILVNLSIKVRFRFHMRDLNPSSYSSLAHNQAGSSCLLLSFSGSGSPVVACLLSLCWSGSLFGLHDPFLSSLGSVPLPHSVSLQHPDSIPCLDLA